MPYVRQVRLLIDYRGHKIGDIFCNTPGLCDSLIAKKRATPLPDKGKSDDEAKPKRRRSKAKKERSADLGAGDAGGGETSVPDRRDAELS